MAVLLDHGLREFLELGSLLLLGCGIAATIQTLIPRDLFLAVGQAPTLSVLSLMLLAVVVSVCSSVDAFLALGFAAMVTPGALLAFLLLGPVIDLKSISLFSRIFRRRGIADAGWRCGGGAVDRPMAQPGAAELAPPFVLGLWGAVLLQAWGSGRLNLLLQADFHWLVLVSGLLLLAPAGLARAFPETPQRPHPRW